MSGPLLTLNGHSWTVTGHQRYKYSAYEFDLLYNFWKCLRLYRQVGKTNSLLERAWVSPTLVWLHYTHACVCLFGPTTYCKSTLLQIMEFFRYRQLIQNMLDSSFNGGPTPLAHKTTSSKATERQSEQQRRQECVFFCPCHLFTNDFMGIMYTAHQQWWRVAQRLQWSFARGSIMGYGQQQKCEQHNSILYVAAISTHGL